MIRESNRHWLTWEKDRTERELQARIQLLRDGLLVLFCIAGIIATLFLTGCAAPYWKQTGAPSASYSWHVVSRSTLDAMCPVNDPMLQQVQACAFHAPYGHCRIFSTRPENAAKIPYKTGYMSVREHELRHCEGWEHE